MSRTLIVVIVFVGLTFFAVAIYILSFVLKKSKAWFELQPLIEFSVQEANQLHDFHVSTPGVYVICVGAKRDLKLVRPALNKIMLEITHNQISIPLKTGWKIFRELTSRTNLKEVVYVIGEFKADSSGDYTIKLQRQAGVNPWDRFFIKPKLF